MAASGWAPAKIAADKPRGCGFCLSVRLDWLSIKIMSGLFSFSIYFTLPITAEATSITDKLPALKLRSTGCSNPISSVEITPGLSPIFFAVCPNKRVVVRLPHSCEVPPTKITGVLGL